MLLELGALEVATKQVARAELSDPQIAGSGWLLERRRGAQSLASHYFQSSAPRRQT